MVRAAAQSGAPSVTEPAIQVMPEPFERHPAHRAIEWIAVLNALFLATLPRLF